MIGLGTDRLLLRSRDEWVGDGMGVVWWVGDSFLPNPLHKLILKYTPLLL